jgi:hypothetical protein
MVVDPATRRIVGQLVPPQVASVRITGGSGEQAHETDRLGRFDFDDVPPGPVRLSVRATDGTTVTTEWVLL